MNRLIGMVAIVISEKLFYYFYTIKCYFSFFTVDQYPLLLTVGVIL